MKFPDIGGGSNSQNGGLFIKMKDGDRLTGIFVGDPHLFRQHWIEGRSALCVGKDACQNCSNGDKPKFRFRLNFLTKEDGIWVCKIFDGNYGTFKDLKEMHENSYTLPETLVTVSRSGEKTNTRYVVMPVKNNGGLKPVDFQKLTKIPLNDLSGKGDAQESGEGDASFDTESFEGVPA